MTALADIERLAIRLASGLADIEALRIRTVDGLRVIWAKASSLAAAPTALYVGGAAASAGTVTVTTTPTDLTISGGTPPYNVSWAKTLGAAGWSITDPSQSFTSFAIALPAEAEADAEFVATVTDARGNSVATSPVVASAYNYGRGL